MTSLQRATEAVGGAGKLADALGIRVQAIYQWKGQIPHRRVLDVERITGVSRHDLRPDLYPKEAA